MERTEKISLISNILFSSGVRSIDSERLAVEILEELEEQESLDFYGKVSQFSPD